MKNLENPVKPTSRLKRDLGTLQSYATLIGILIGAGIFKVTGDAWTLTGPSVILGYVVLTPAILATSIPYSAYLSTSLGRDPAGEYLHISRTLGGFRLAFVAVWLKIISYFCAGAYLAHAMAVYLITLTGINEWFRLPLALAALLIFYTVHVIGVSWFGWFQVSLSALKCLALLVMILPGLFMINRLNYSPFFTHGVDGFGVSLLPLFFAYAGFESIAQTSGEVKDSTHRLPRILLKGITITALIYFFTSLVSFGVLPGELLQQSKTPLIDVPSSYLPAGAAIFVIIGAIAATMTALNGTIYVPSRLALTLVNDGLAPRWLGFVSRVKGTPIPGLTVTLICTAVLLISEQFWLALQAAVFALVVLYFIHSLVFLFLPRLNPVLESEIEIGMSRRVQQGAAIFSILSMGLLICIQLLQDVTVLRAKTLSQLIRGQSLTTIELIVIWGFIGAVIYQFARRQRASQAVANGD